MENANEINSKIQEELADMGFNSSTKGTEYLVEVIACLMDKERTNERYNDAVRAIADRRVVTFASVDRSMVRAVNYALAYGDFGYIESKVGKTEIGDFRDISARTFAIRLANSLHRESKHDGIDVSILRKMIVGGINDVGLSGLEAIYGIIQYHRAIA